MNLYDIENVIKHILKTCKCVKCQKKYTPEDVHIIATTKTEGLLEAICSKCKIGTILTVTIDKIDKEAGIDTNREKSPTGIRPIHGVSENDILDVKNFLNDFDGNFKKIFTNNK